MSTFNTHYLPCTEIPFAARDMFRMLLLAAFVLATTTASDIASCSGSNVRR